MTAEKENGDCENNLGRANSLSFDLCFFSNWMQASQEFNGVSLTGLSKFSRSFHRLARRSLGSRGHTSRKAVDQRLVHILELLDK